MFLFCDRGKEVKFGFSLGLGGKFRYADAEQGGEWLGGKFDVIGSENVP